MGTSILTHPSCMAGGCRKFLTFVGRLRTPGSLALVGLLNLNVCAVERLYNRSMAALSQPLKCSQSKWKSVIFLIVFGFGLLYFLAPYVRSSGRRYVFSDKVERCLEDKLRAHSSSRDLFDTVIYRHPQGAEADRNFIPYVGNGYFGISLDDSQGLWVKGRRELSVATGLNPLLYTTIVGYETKVATVIDIKAGVVYRYQCLYSSDAASTAAVQITHEVFAHRTRPGILVQDVRIYNPSKHDAVVSLIQSGLKDWTPASVKVDNRSFASAQEFIPWRSTQRKLAWADDDDANRGMSSSTVSAGIAITPQLVYPGDTLEIKAGRTETFHLLSGFRHSGPIQPSAYDHYDIRELHSSLMQEIRAAQRLSPSALKDEHAAVWNQLWLSGFAISPSKAPDALNGDVINTTMYYVLSNVPSLATLSVDSDLDNLLTAKSSEGVTGAASQSTLLSLLARPENCFSGARDTLTLDKFWKPANSMGELNAIIRSWLITLEKQGCSNYVRAGADGVLQAMVLSIGNLRFSKEHDVIAHLEMHMDPSNLHRDFVFRRIAYGNTSVHINISVTVGDDNRATLRVSVDKADRGYYACDAECLSPSQSIGPDGVSILVKITQPVHPILYITHNKGHIEELKHALHMEDVKLAPAHDHRVIAMHKHGYSYGGLPFIFWVLLGGLLVTFHLFLFKLIYTECQQSQGSVSASAYQYRKRADS